MEKYKDDLARLQLRFKKDVHRPTIADFIAFKNIDFSEEHVRKVLISNGIPTNRTTKIGKKEIWDALKEKIKVSTDNEEKMN